MFGASQKVYGEKNERVVIVFGGWGTTQRQLWVLGQLLASFNFKTIIITWPKDILTPDVALTRDRFIKIRDDCIKIITSLPKNQQENLSLFGISQGSIIACMVTSQLPTVHKLILNLSGSNTAEIIWSWDNVIPGFKERITKKTTLSELKKLWGILDPLTNLKRVMYSIFFFISHRKMNSFPLDFRKNYYSA